MATRSVHVVGLSDASDVVVLVIGNASVVRALLLLVLALWTLVLLASRAVLHPLSQIGRASCRERVYVLV